VEEFSPEKIYDTCIRAGANDQTAKEIANEISKIVYDGIKSSEILSIIRKLLRKKNKGLAARYNLKESLTRLGPTGYPFENFISELLEYFGYKTKLRQILRGKCVEHEIDVLAESEQNNNLRRAIIEVKFKHANELYIGLKEAMYTYARYLDIKEGYELNLCDRVDEVWLFCNSKASSEAIQYANCKGLKLITWNYPFNDGLRKMIHEMNLYPVTILNSIDKKLLLKFADSHIMFIRDIYEYDEKRLMSKFDLTRSKVRNILDEANQVLSINKK
jgi:hypothetical protein